MTNFWISMELKSSFIAILVLILLAPPYRSRGEKVPSNLGSEIYEIDYRGPETHSYIPSPNRGRPYIHPEVMHHKSKVLGSANARKDEKKNHG